MPELRVVVYRQHPMIFRHASQSLDATRKAQAQRVGGYNVETILTMIFLLTFVTGMQTNLAATLLSLSPLPNLNTVDGLLRC